METCVVESGGHSTLFKICTAKQALRRHGQRTRRTQTRSSSDGRRNAQLTKMTETLAANQADDAQLTRRT